MDYFYGKPQIQYEVAVGDDGPRVVARETAPANLVGERVAPDGSEGVAIFSGKVRSRTVYMVGCFTLELGERAYRHWNVFDLEHEARSALTDLARFHAVGLEVKREQHRDYMARQLQLGGVQR